MVDIVHNAVDRFPAGVLKPKKIGAITAGINAPVDVIVDTAGTLYVSNDGKPNATITEYAAGSSVPNRTLTLPDVHPGELAVGPDGTVYVMTVNSRQRYKVLEFDPGASSPSRVITLPYEYPYPLVGTGIAVNKDNFLYVNEGGFNSGGGFALAVYAPKQLKSFKTFSVNEAGYPDGAVKCYEDRVFVGDPEDNAVDIERLPVRSPFDVRVLPTVAGGDFLTVDYVSNYLYVSSGDTATIQIYDLRTGRLLDFLTGFSSGVAVQPPPL